MANASEASFMEQHIEKGILALSVLLLVYVLFHWVLGSPVEFVTGDPSKIVGPAQVDEYLFNQAQKVKQKMDAPTPKIPAPPDYVGVFKQLRDKPMAQDYTELVEFLSPAGQVSGTTVVQAPPQLAASLAELEAAVPAPLTPVVRACRQLRQVAKAEDENAVYGAGIFDRGDLADAWSKKLGGTQMSLAVLEVIVERREQQANGQWSNAHQIAPIAKDLDAAGKPLAPLPNLAPFDGANGDEINKAAEVLRTAVSQRRILQPDYWNVFDRGWTNWRINLPWTSLSDRAREEGPTPTGTTATPVPAVTPAVTAAVSPAMTGTAARATRPTTGPARPPVAPRVAVPGQPLAPTPTPSYERQVELGQVLAWFQDSPVDSATKMQYRMRLKLMNPLLAQEKSAKNPDDAKPASILSPWSEWSALCQAPRVAEFYIVGAFENNQTVSATVITTSRGQRVSRQFTSLVVGQPIGKPVKMDVLNPMDNVVGPVNVDFGTGATIVSIDFNKQFVRGRVAKKTVEVIYLDDSGQLKSRLLAIDEARVNEVEK